MAAWSMDGITTMQFLFFSKFTLRQTSFEPEVQFLHEHINLFGKFDSYIV